MQADATPEPVKDVTYDAKQRVRTLSVDGQLKAEYRYDARNLRTKKTLYDEAGAVSAEVYYHYDANGLLIGESDAQGQVRREYVYLGMMPVAQIDIDSQGQESVVYFLTDQLATPRLGIDQGQAVVWKWESDAYGAMGPSGSATVNLRFAGQYFDAESGWYYNWHRYYLPKDGRYLTSDPIGLDGGLNTYGYVFGNPIKFIDPRGLDNPSLLLIDPDLYYESAALEHGYDISTKEGVDALNRAQAREAAYEILGGMLGGAGGKVLGKIALKCRPLIPNTKGIPGIDKPFREANSAHPPNASLVEQMNSMKICSGTDCSEIAEKLFNASAGNGKILQVTGSQGNKVKKLFEYDEVVDNNGYGFGYHDVFTDGRYVYDPRLSPFAIPKGDWIQMIKGLNPGSTIKRIQ